MTERLAAWLSWLAIAVLWAAVYLVVNGCSSGSSSDSEAAPSAVPATAKPVPSDTPERLSEWGQLEVRAGRLHLGESVVPYTLSSPLFSDYAQKLRTVSLPGGGPAAYDPDEVFDFPVGTVITKTFYYPVEPAGPPESPRVLRTSTTTEDLSEPLDLTSVRLIETRVLVRRSDGWHAMPYVWNDEQTEALLQRTGDLVSLTLVDGDAETPFTYAVPDVNQCASCHATNHTSGDLEPIGPKARHLNIDVDYGDGPTSQLQQWQELGLLGPSPDPADVTVAAVWDDDTASLDERARSYLDINCAHCHNRAGAADTSGLFLERATELGPELGVCKQPVAAGTGTGGRAVGIEPGEPDESIFVFRMASTDPAAMMPELGRSLVHDEGLELITTWIASLDGSC